jgi:uncharacterized protein YbjT (DUF2867 family)
MIDPFIDQPDFPVAYVSILLSFDRYDESTELNLRTPLMTITIAGAHGQIARLLHPILLERGHTVRGIIRSPEQAKTLQKAGVEPVLCDLEKESLVPAVHPDSDAVIFAAGAGPGSGEARKWSVDRDGALKLIEAARSHGIRRYLMISAMKLDQPRGSQVFRTYLKAKAEADQSLRQSGLDYTIIKPGKLTDEAGRGTVRAGSGLERGEIPRADVAATVAETLDLPSTIGKEFDLVGGDMPIRQALEQLNG